MESRTTDFDFVIVSFGSPAFFLAQNKISVQMLG